MSKITVRSALLVAAAFTWAALAQAEVTKPAAKSTTPAKSSASTAAKPSATKSTSHSATGTIESYDSASKTLTVKGAKSTWTFSVADAKVWSGAKSVGVDDLSSDSGSHVTVKYDDKDGQKVASSVRVAAAAVKHAPKAK